MGARVARHEDNGADGNVGLQQLLGRDDGTNGVSMKMEGKLVKGAGKCSVSCDVCATGTSRYMLHACSSQDRIGGDVQFSRSLPGLVLATRERHRLMACSAAYIGVSQDSGIQHYIVDFEVRNGRQLGDEFLARVSRVSINDVYTVLHDTRRAEESGTYDYAFLGQDVANVHLTAPVIAASLPPQGRGMGGKGFADGSYDALIPLQKLAHEFEAYASACAENEPCGVVFVGVQYVRDLVHLYCGGGERARAAGRNDEQTEFTGQTKVL